MRDDAPVVKLDRTAILADDHQHVDGSGRRWVGALTRQRMHINVTLRTKASADGAAGNVLAEQKPIDFGLGNFVVAGICHHTHREITFPITES
jgi:hypothetical protein